MRKKLLISMVAAMAATFQIQANTLELEKPFVVKSGGEILNVGEMGHATPLFIDWDGDGLNDLLVGQYGYNETNGAVRVYKNIGTASNPKFDGFTYIEANGKTNLVPIGCCVSSRPQFADMNGDGIRDMVSGSWPGEIHLFYGRKDGSFAAPEFLKDSNGDEIFVGKASVVAMEDWDRDGDLDLTIGAAEGEVYFIPKEAGQFGAPMALQADGEIIKGHHGGPELADWDGNGTIDLLLADGDGRVRFFPNQNAEGMPQLGAAVELVPAAGEADDAPGIRAKINVADYNGDGKLDLLLGDAHLEYPEKLVLSEEDRKAQAKAKAEFRSAVAKNGTMYREQIQPEVMRRLGITDVKSVVWDIEMMAKSHNISKAVAEEHPEYKSSVQEVDRAAKEQAKFFAAPNSSGYIWVFLRKG